MIHAPLFIIAPAKVPTACWKLKVPELRTMPLIVIVPPLLRIAHRIPQRTAADRTRNAPRLMIVPLLTIMPLLDTVPLLASRPRLLSVRSCQGRRCC